MAPGDLSKTLATLTILLDGGAVQHQGSSADALAVEAGAPHAGADSLDDERPFQLRDCADDDHDGAAQRPAGVDLFAEADELDAQTIQLVQHLKEVPGRASDAIACPDQHDIEAPALGIPHQLVQTRPARLCAGDPVGVLLHDLGPALSSHLAQVRKLRLRVLIDGGDTQVEPGALQARLLFGLAAYPDLAT